MSHDEIRLSDNERMTALQALGTHFADGRLDITEFNERTAKVGEARTIGELRPLFDDLPGGIPFQPGSLTPNLPATTANDTSRELAELKKKGDLIKTIDSVAGSLALIVFFLGLFVFHWSYSWLAFLAVSPVILLSRQFLGVNSADEKALKALEKQEEKERQQRLLEAEKRMKELGS